MERSKTSVVGVVGKKLRAELEDADDLPERLIDLIRQLRERERPKSEASPAEGSSQADPAPSIP